MRALMRLAISYVDITKHGTTANHFIGSSCAKKMTNSWERSPLESLITSGIGFCFGTLVLGQGLYDGGRQKSCGLGIKATGDLSCLVGLRCGQYRFGTRDGESGYGKRRHSAPLVGPPEYQSRAEGCLLLRDHKVNLPNDTWSLNRCCDFFCWP